MPSVGCGQDKPLWWNGIHKGLKHPRSKILASSNLVSGTSIVCQYYTKSRAYIFEPCDCDDSDKFPFKIGDVIVGKSGAPYGITDEHCLCVVNDLLLYRGDWYTNDISVLCIGFDTYGYTDKANSEFYVEGTYFKKCDRTTLNNYDIDPRFSEYLICDSDGVHFDVEGYLADINA